MSLYQFKACPFCVKVRRKLRKYSLNIELKDAKNNNLNRNNLKTLRRKIKSSLPKNRLLKMIFNGWVESKEIINYLETEFKLTTN